MTHQRLHFGKKPMSLFFAFLVLSSTLVMLVAVSPVRAQQTRVFLINPSTGGSNFTFFTNSSPLGTRFSILINVSDITDLFGWTVYVNYSPLVLNFTRAELPTDHVFSGRNFQILGPNVDTRKESSLGPVDVANPIGSKWGPFGKELNLTDWLDVDKNGKLSAMDFVWLQPKGESTQPYRVKEVMQTPSGIDLTWYEPYMYIGATLLGSPTFSGSGKLASVEFEIVGWPPKRGEAIFTLDINDTRTELLDSNSNTIETVKEGGEFRYIWVEPSSKPYLAVDPSVKEYTSSPPSSVGQQFNITVSVKDLDPLWYLHNATFSLSYNGTFLDVTGNTTDPTWSEKTFSITLGALNKIKVSVIANPRRNPPEGNVVVITIEFNVTKQGQYPTIYESPLTLNDVQLMSTLEEIPTSRLDHGKVMVNGLLITPLEVRPHRYITNRLEKFDIEIWLNNLAADQRLTSLQFRLTYNATLLRVVDVTEGPFMASFPNNPTNATWFLWKNETNGVYGPNVLVGIFLFPNASWQYHNFPNGTGLLATIVFEGIYRRGFDPEKNVSPLELVDVILLDDEFNDIVTTPINGFYELLSYKAPEAEFTISPPILNVTSTVFFNASRSRDFNLGNISSYRWDFGDGNVTDVNQTIIRHVYTMPGIYTVNLTVTDDDGQTDWFALNITVWKLTSIISIDVTPPVIAFGQNATIHGSINPLRRNVSVRISYRLQDETEWKIFRDWTTDAEGKYSLAWSPTKIGTYELTASWFGDNITDPDESSTIALVNRARSTLTINLDKATVIVGSKVTVTGTLQPQQPNASVTVFSRQRGGTWSTLATVEVNSTTGGYISQWTTTHAGIYELRASFSGDENLGPTQSSIMVLTVNRAPSTITISVSQESITVGSEITISGAIRPKKAEVDVTLLYRRQDEMWTTLAEVKTDNNSRYTYTWKIEEIGTFEVKASWSGDADTLPSESGTISINIEAQPTAISLYITIASLTIIAILVVTIIYRRKIKQSSQTIR